MSRRLYKGICIALAAGLLFGLAQVQDSMNHDRETLGLTRAQPLENAPPVLAFTTVALGGFRGLISNLLWMRATDLQDEDKFFEMVQLADCPEQQEQREPVQHMPGEMSADLAALDHDSVAQRRYPTRSQAW